MPVVSLRGFVLSRIEHMEAAHNFLMMNMEKMETGIKIAKLLGVTAAVYLGMKFILPVALPFLIALLLARLLYPLAISIERRAGLKRPAARFAAYGIFLVAIGAFFAGLLYLCYHMGSKCLDHMDYVMESANGMFFKCCEKLEEISGFKTEEIQTTISNQAGSFAKGAVEYSKEAGWQMMGFLAKMFVTFIAAFLILNDYEKIRAGVKKTQTGRYAVGLYQEIKTALGAYLRAQMMIMGIVTAVCIAGLFLLQIKGAFWLGLAIGVFDALPFLGTGTIFVPWALIELLLGGYVHAAGFLVIYIVCNFIREILEPKLVGRHLGIPPLAVLVSIYIGLWVYGGPGVLLGPVSALIIWEIYRSFSR